MSGHLQELETALQYYSEKNMSVDFENGNMFLGMICKKKKTWEFEEVSVIIPKFSLHRRCSVV